jgi:hypothetical protein
MFNKLWIVRSEAIRALHSSRFCIAGVRHRFATVEVRLLQQLPVLNEPIVVIGLRDLHVPENRRSKFEDIPNVRKAVGWTHSPHGT